MRATEKSSCFTPALVSSFLINKGEGPTLPSLVNLFSKSPKCLLPTFTIDERHIDIEIPSNEYAMSSLHVVSRFCDYDIPVTLRSNNEPPSRALAGIPVISQICASRELYYQTAPTLL
jgi:hypothetical protein